MRSWALLIPLFVVAAACAAPASNGDEEGTVSSKQTVGTKCQASRAEILASVSGERLGAIQRGFTWLDAQVPYSQSKTHGGYRTDCSGFVSMCWQASTPGLTTSTFATSSDFHFLDSYDDLLPGDAIDDPGHHIVLFLGWDDSDHDSACVLEQASTASDMQFRVRTASSLKKSGFKPIRPNDFSDTVARTSNTTPDSGATTCTPMTAEQACTASAATVECGTIADGCGGKVSCDDVENFGCTSDATCTNHKCVKKADVTGTPSTLDAGSSSSSSSSDVGTQAGDPGDTSEGWANDSSEHNASAGGCAAAPGTSTREAGTFGLALAVAAALVRRRRRAA